jgi:hypothetical protein
MPEHSSQSNGLHTGMNAPRSGFCKVKTTGEVIQTEEGSHLPPDPQSRDSTEWEFVGEQAPSEYRGR